MNWPFRRSDEQIAFSICAVDFLTKRLRRIREPEQSSESGQGWSVFKLILIELDVKKRIQIELPPASGELLSVIPNFVNIYKICLSW